jgi:hypothetical protein
MRSLGRRGLRQRVPDAVRREVMGYVEEARREGRPWSEITATLRLSKSALTRWRRSARSPKPALRRVVVAPVAPAPRVVVVLTAAGHRVEGLTLPEAAVRLLPGSLRPCLTECCLSDLARNAAQNPYARPSTSAA